MSEFKKQNRRQSESFVWQFKTTSLEEERILDEVIEAIMCCEQGNSNNSSNQQCQ